jgi:hypothetical protein
VFLSTAVGLPIPTFFRWVVICRGADTPVPEKFLKQRAPPWSASQLSTLRIRFCAGVF